MSPVRSLVFAAAFGIAAAAGAEERPNPMQPSETWEAIAPGVIGESEPIDGEALLEIEAPFRAHDAAIVPIRITQEEGTPRITRLTLIVDENPAPVAAEFTLGEAMHPLALETRVRVNAYSNVRVIAETEDGALHMAGRFVRASGGCAAPAMKDAEEAMASLGETRVRWFDAESPASGAEREAQVMFRHPNYSGLQRDQITQLFTPAHFVDEVEVRQGDALLFSMTGGISLSEDPSFRFRYADDGTGGLSVTASDTEGETFGGDFTAGM